MSAKRLDLKSPPVVALVLVLLVAVAAFNVMTFGPGRHDRGRGAGVRVQAYQALPSDLGEMVRLAGDQLRGSAAGPAEAEHPRPDLERDPFSPYEETRPEPTRKRAPRQVSGRPAEPPAVSAILVTGRGPVALIAGRSCSPGDQVEGFQVVEVDLQGVVLMDARGRTVTVKVNGNGSKGGSFEISGGVDGSEQAAILAAAMDAEERKLP
ncbi:MAG: hypothetical protein AB7V45_07160 [Candidatus Krumholzibacteriia bacterium]